MQLKVVPPNETQSLIFKLPLGVSRFDTYDDTTGEADARVTQLRDFLVGTHGRAQIRIFARHIAPQFVAVDFIINTSGLREDAITIAGRRKSRHQLLTDAICIIDAIGGDSSITLRFDLQ